MKICNQLVRKWVISRYIKVNSNDKISITKNFT